MRWMLGLFAVVGLLVIGLAVAIASGLVNVSAFDPFSKLNAAATRPASGPSDEDSTDSEKPIDSEASLAALKHPGYQERVVFLSAADAKVMGPRVQLEARTSSSYYSGRSGRGGAALGVPRGRSVARSLG